LSFRFLTLQLVLFSGFFLLSSSFAFNLTFLIALALRFLFVLEKGLGKHYST